MVPCIYWFIKSEGLLHLLTFARVGSLDMLVPFSYWIFAFVGWLRWLVSCISSFFASVGFFHILDSRICWFLTSVHIIHLLVFCIYCFLNRLVLFLHLFFGASFSLHLIFWLLFVCIYCFRCICCFFASVAFLYLLDPSPFVFSHAFTAKNLATLTYQPSLHVDVSYIPIIFKLSCVLDIYRSEIFWEFWILYDL